MISAIIKSIKTAIEYSYSETNNVTNGNFDLTGNELVTNGNFSATSAELLENGNFSSGEEGLTGGDFESGLIGDGVNYGSPEAVFSWTLNTISPISGTQDGKFAVTTPGSENSYPRIRFDGGLQLNKSYVLTFDYKVNSGNCHLGSIFKGGGSSEIVSTTLSGSGTHTFYFQGLGTGDLFLNFKGSQVFEVQIDNVSIKELGKDWTLESGWSINEDGAYYDGTGGTNRNITQNIGITDSKSYKIEFTVFEISAGEVAVRFGGMAGVSEITATSTGTYTGYITANSSANGDVLIEDNDNSFVGSVSSISVFELGEGWRGYGAGVNAGVMSFNANGLVITAATSFSGTDKVAQTDFNNILDGKPYKVEYTIHDNSLTGSAVLEYYNGTTYVSLPNQSVGTHTFYYTKEGVPPNDDGWYFQIENSTNTSDNITISSISVKEVGQHWTVGAGWSIGNQKLIANDPTENTSQRGVFETGVSKYYKINLKVSDYTSGSFKVITSGNTAQSQAFSANNDYEFDLLSNNPTDTDLIFSFDGDFIGSISEVSVKERITESPELTKVRTLCGERVYALKQADGANTPCVIVQLVGCEPNHTKDGGSSTEVNAIEITCIASHPRTAFQMAALLRMGFNKSKILTDKNEGVTIDEMIFLNWASDVFEPTDMYTMTLRFEAFSSLRQDLTNYL